MIFVVILVEIFLITSIHYICNGNWNFIIAVVNAASVVVIGIIVILMIMIIIVDINGKHFSFFSPSPFPVESKTIFKIVLWRTFVIQVKWPPNILIAIWLVLSPLFCFLFFILSGFYMSFFSEERTLILVTISSLVDFSWQVCYILSLNFMFFWLPRGKLDFVCVN